MRTWLAIALLAGSWLWGFGYFQPRQPVAWCGLLAVAVLLLSDLPVRRPSKSYRIAALLLLLPTLWLVPMPGKVIPVLLVAGTLASFAPGSTRWLRRGAGAVWLAGLILTAQGLVLSAYRDHTARAHEMPEWCGQLLAAAARLLGADAAWDQGAIVLRHGATTLRAGATWELLCDPGSVCFLTGAVVLWLLVEGQRRLPLRATSPPLGRLLALTALWLPLRALLLLTVAFQQQLRATTITAPNVGELFVSTWVHVVLLVLLAVVCGVLISWRAGGTQPAAARRSARPAHWRQAAAVTACSLGAALLTFSHFWVATGQEKPGRVMFVERHSSWEPTTEPYRDQVYGESGSYNYAAAYEYCSQYFTMSRLLKSDRIDLETLEQCDVLVIKTPTERYAPDEVAAVIEFVNRGGSLLMIGDHTNVFNMCTYLNDMARPMGFTFRNDLLFAIGDPYHQHYDLPAVRHPILQYMSPMDFAVSCSIDPGRSEGEMVIRNVGLYNLPPAYQESNYHPQAEYRPQMQYGAWCQLWATTHGEGRVVAFADSTLFSNFCVFQPGKVELLMGMLQWLNHTSAWDAPATRRLLDLPLRLVGVSLMLLGWFTIRRRPSAWLLVLAGCLLAWATTLWLVDSAHARAMPLPQRQHALQQVVIDRTVSEVPLFTGAFSDDPDGNGYGMLEQWIPRVGGYISRRQGLDTFQGDALVMICPTRLPSQQYRSQLISWVEQGGRLLIFDSPDLPNSTANSILNLFGLSSLPGAAKPDEEDEPVRATESEASTPLLMSCEVSGGEAVATWGGTPVAARAVVGQGSVTVVGFSSLFNDANMGTHWMSEPDEELRKRYDMLFALLRSALHDNPAAPHAPESPRKE